MLAHEKLGISRNYKYLSSIRQQLDPALEELCEKGFLAGFRYEGKGRGAQLIVDSALRRTSISARKGRKKKKGEGKGGGNLRLEIEIMLEERGINPERLASVLDSYGEELLRKVKQIICYYDTLVEQNSRLVSKNRTGFLFRAVERARGFVLPGPFGSRGQVSIFPSQRRLTQSSDLGQANSYEDRGDCGEDDEVDRLRAQYLVERKREAKRLMSTAEPSILEKVRAEVERDLSKFRGNISESNFASVVDHGVEERLLKLFAFPGFDEWMLSRSAPRRS
ncbi:MAG: hypothetical protein D6808_03850 [Candidatus Dadabacteria bacterium]|nr:MAG: hypothetical protein D6808_03850 [Candidatus Dadabacteria bacterium]